MRPLLLLLFVAGCAGIPPTAPEPSLPDDDSCGIKQFSGLIGQDATELEKVLILGPIRLIRPDTFVTEDYRPQRANVYIDASEKIFRLACG